MPTIIASMIGTYNSTNSQNLATHTIVIQIYKITYQSIHTCDKYVYQCKI